MADNITSGRMWKDAASATEDCLLLDVLGRMMENAPADPKTAAHLAGCPHCHTELTMLKNFETSAAGADEGAAVVWVAAQLQRQQSGPARQSAALPVLPFWRSLFRMPYLAAAAAAAIVLALGVSLYSPGIPADGPRRVTNPQGIGVYRASAVHLESPSGNLAQAPAEFRWEAYPGAASYTVEITDVLGTVLSSAQSTQTSLATSPNMQANIWPGKPLKWKVTARDASGKAIADSSAQGFKVK
jgi:hypothetical protein